MVLRFGFGLRHLPFGGHQSTLAFAGYGSPDESRTRSLHRTAAKRCSFDAPDSSDAAFAGSARSRRQSVSSDVRPSCIVSESSIEEFFECPKCGRQNWGFARCQTPGCGELRSEFRGREGVVVRDLGRCVLSGSWSDVRLPNGDYLWAPYFLVYVDDGWLDESYRYTDTYYASHPSRRRDDEA